MLKLLVIGLCGVCSSISLMVNEAKAATIDYNFDANYVVNIGMKPISNLLSLLYFDGASDDALYGLNTVGGNSFVSIHYNGNYVASTSPAYISKQMNFVLSDEFKANDSFVVLGNGLNKLFLREYASGVLDMNRGVGSGAAVLSVFDGEGLFENATGYVDVLEDIKIKGFDDNNNLQASIKQVYKFNIQTLSQPKQVPENDGVLYLLAPIAMIYGLSKYRSSNIIKEY